MATEQVPARRRGRPALGDECKEKVTLRLPPAVLAFYRSSGRGWQTRLSHDLEAIVASSRIRA